MHRRLVWTIALAGGFGIAADARADFSGHVSIVNSVAFSADGKFVLSGSWDWTMRLWDLASQKTIRKYKSHTLSVNSATFGPRGETVLSASADGSLKRWQLSDGKLLNTYRGHTGIVTSGMISPDGKFVLSASTDKT